MKYIDEYRDPRHTGALLARLGAVAKQCGPGGVSIMHVCGSHERAIAKFGIRAILPPGLEVIMGPGCPVCVSDTTEVDEAIALALDGKLVLTYGDMLRVPGTRMSLAEAKAQGAAVRVVYGPAAAVAVAEANPSRDTVFFATGFETTAAATAGVILAGPPPKLLFLSAHKYIPPVMEIVAEMPQTRVQGFLAAGHAATVTGWGVFEPFVRRHALPVVVSGFEPVDILCALIALVELIRDGRAEVKNAYPRCVTREGNRDLQRALWEVFEPVGGRWRGIAHIPNGNLRFRDAYRAYDARVRFRIDTDALEIPGLSDLARQCICGDIMSGVAIPYNCALFGKECNPLQPVGACMVSSEGTCRIWFEYGGQPERLAVGKESA